MTSGSLTARRWVAGATGVVLALALSAVPAVASPRPRTGAAPTAAAGAARLDNSVGLRSRLVAAGGEVRVEVGEKTYSSAPDPKWACPTGVWVLVLERDSLEQLSSKNYPLCEKADGTDLTAEIKKLDPEDGEDTPLIIVNSLDRVAGHDPRVLLGLGGALAAVGARAEDFESLDLTTTAFSVVGLAGVPAGQAFMATTPLAAENGLAVGTPSPASIDADLDVDNHNQYAVTMRDYVVYDIGADGAITIDHRVYEVPERTSAFRGGFHLVVVDRRTLRPVSNRLYSTNDNMDEQIRMAQDLNRLADDRGQSALVFLASVGQPLDQQTPAAGPIPLSAPCRGSGPFTVTCTYTRTSEEQSFTVPSSINGHAVTSLHVTAQGGLGGDAGFPEFRAAGGHPDQVTGDVAVGAGTKVTPGQTLYVQVGGDGEDGGKYSGGQGGWNGGAGGGDSDLNAKYGWPGGGGGGASDIRTTTRADGAASLASRLVVAGGGGGAGGNSHGGGRGGDGGVAHGRGGTGLPGNAVPSSRVGRGGGGGTPTAGGDGGDESGRQGSLGAGGVGATPNLRPYANNGGGSGGGGGAGLYGGGGGGTPRNYDNPNNTNSGGGGGGGGGGRDLVPAGGTSRAVADRSPASVTISYQVPLGTLAQALRPWGATPDIIEGLIAHPRYALAGSLATPAQAELGLSPDSPEANAALAKSDSGRLEGVLQRGRTEMYYDSVTSIAVRGGSSAATKASNYALFDVLGHGDAPWPVPAIGPHHDGQQKALTFLSDRLCDPDPTHPVTNCPGVRDRYADSGGALNSDLNKITKASYVEGHGFTAEDFATVQQQIETELDYAIGVAELEQRMHQILTDGQLGKLSALTSAYDAVRDSVAVENSESLAVPIIRYLIELLSTVAELSGLEPVSIVLGILGAAILFGSETTNNKDGSSDDILRTTVGKLGEDTAEQFLGALTGLGRTFGVVLSDWGKLSAVGRGLRNHSPDWAVGQQDEGQVVTATTRAAKVGYFRALLGAEFLRYEAQGAATGDPRRWCLTKGCSNGPASDDFGFYSHYGFKIGTSMAAYGPAPAPTMAFRSVYDNIVVRDRQGVSDPFGNHALKPELMTKMKDTGLYPPYLFLRWQMGSKKPCPQDLMNYSCRDSALAAAGAPVSHRPRTTAPRPVASVRPVAAVRPVPAAGATGGTRSTTVALAATGGPVGSLALVALLLVVSGAGLEVLSRRRPGRPGEVEPS